MSRVTLTDDSGRWFDDDCTCFDESTRWNGNNHISCATGSQWNHEALYYTRSGRWVLYAWSQWQGSLPTYCSIDESEAVAWLIQQEYFDPEGLPAPIQAAVASAMDANEV